MSYKNTPDAWKMDGLELSVEQKLNDVYDIASTAASGALPSVSSADNGKALLVKSGKWQKAAIPSQLPTVSADDNGDVLTVVEGAWAKAAPSGGGVLAITETYDSTEETHTLNKTWQEIFTAYTSGYICYVIVENVGGLSGVTDYNLVVGVESAPDAYSVITSGGTIYVAEATSDYPSSSD